MKKNEKPRVIILKIPMKQLVLVNGVQEIPHDYLKEIALKKYKVNLDDYKMVPNTSKKPMFSFMFELKGL